MALTTLEELVTTAKALAGMTRIDLGELTAKEFYLITKNKVMPFVGKHIPTVVSKEINIAASPYLFTTEIPDWISRVVPLDITPINMNLHTIFGMNPNQPKDIAKPQFLTKYERPKLYVENPGRFLVECCYTPTIVLKDGGDPKKLTDYEFTAMDDDAEEHIYKLFQGYMMQAVGFDRRTATLTDLPIELDADGLISDGKDLVEEAIADTTDSSKSHLGIG